MSTQHDEAAFRVLLARSVGDARARLVSTSAPGASAWLLTAVPQPKSWLDGQAFLTALRWRLGLRVLSQRIRCGLGCQALADEHGVHTLNCMAGGQRTLIHHSLADTLHAIATTALLYPRREPMILGNGWRLDYSLHGVPGHRTVGVDVAIINALGSTHLDRACTEAGGAATAYEAKKRAKYERPTTRAGIHFVPFVVDTFGALGAAAQVHIRVLAEQYARTQFLTRTSAMHYVRHRVGIAIASGVANALLRQEGICRTVAGASGAPPPELAVDHPLF